MEDGSGYSPGADGRFVSELVHGLGGSGCGLRRIIGSRGDAAIASADNEAGRRGGGGLTQGGCCRADEHHGWLLSSTLLISMHPTQVGGRRCLFCRIFPFSADPNH